MAKKVKKAAAKSVKSSGKKLGAKFIAKKPSGKKPATKELATKKPVIRKAVAKKPVAIAKLVTKEAAAKPAQNPEPSTTGAGASPLDIGQTLVAMFNQGKLKEIEEMYWSPAIVSIEGYGVNLAWHGLAKVEAKNHEWMADHQIHSSAAEGPFVGSTGFAVKFKMDVETKSTNQRQVMEEVGVYDVRDGKIVREEFMYFIPRT